MPPRNRHLHIDKPVRYTFKTPYLSRCDILLNDVNPRLERAKALGITGIYVGNLPACILCLTRYFASVPTSVTCLGKSRVFFANKSLFILSAL